MRYPVLGEADGLGTDIRRTVGRVFIADGEWATVPSSQSSEDVAIVLESMVRFSADEGRRIMSWVPAFKIGFWNAWMLMLYLPLHPLIMILVDKAVGTGQFMKKMEDVPYDKKEKRAFMMAMVVMVLLILYSIFLPLKLGTVWFYAGLAIYLLGLGMLVAAIVNAATTPLGQPFVGGLYRYSRHPMLVSMFITWVGVSVASASWLFLLLSIAAMGLQVFEAVAEERGCLELYGDQYRQYLNLTPRWIGIPRSR
jgi:protein-S-isoprenylcysteine O-methyltransferase Ste14